MKIFRRFLFKRGSKFFKTHKLVQSNKGGSISICRATPKFVKISWVKNDIPHRLGGPSYEDTSGTKLWFQNGKLHRLGGPTAEYANGDKEWYQNGELHRLGGPAIEYANGDRYWYQNAKCHRIDGPVV